jgi:NitT/TauT family transport system substrate-binding protein
MVRHLRCAGFFGILLISSLIISCKPAGTAESSAPAAASAVVTAAEGAAKLPALKLGLMPAVDIAPLIVAAEKGYFLAEGLELAYEIYSNAQNRQSALQAGAVDGALTDLVALTLNVAGGFPMKAVVMTDGRFAVMASAALVAEGSAAATGSAGASAPQKKLSIALMEASVTNYLADRWLSDAFILDKVYVNDIGARLETVAAGHADSGVFPEPLATVAASRGLAILAESDDAEPSPQVIAFTEAALAAKSGSIRAFLRAYDRAIADLSSDPQLARKALASSIPNLSEALSQRMELPVYRPAQLPDDRYVQDVIDWTARITGKTITLSPGTLLDRRFVQ